MRKLLTYIFLAFALLTASSCQDRLKNDKVFISSDDVLLKVGTKVEFEYNKYNCQLAYNDQRKEYRASTDNMSDYFVLRLSQAPTSKGQKITGSISWTGDDYLRNLNNISFEVVKINESKAWLWNQPNKVAVVIRRMESQ